jgi:hypothetical protein
MVDSGHLVRTLRRFAAASAVGHLAWETLQLPLYTIWFDGTPAQIAFAVVHCSGGDLLIAGTTLLIALMAFGRGWPADGAAFRNVAVAAITLGVAYTIFSEWLNVSIRQSWAYSAWMPRLPPLGTGLSPVVQWLVVPAISFRWARAGAA